MRIFFIISILFILLISCCEKEPAIVFDEDGAILQKPWLWRTKTCDKDYNGTFIHTPAYTHAGVLVGATDENSIAYLAFLDINNGSFLWKQDYVEKHKVLVFISKYQYNNSIICREGHILFSLNLITGEYNWKTRDESWGFDWLSGIDSLFFNINRVTDPRTVYPIASAYSCNTKNGDQKLLLIPNLGELPEPDLGRVNFSIGGFRYINPFRDSISGDIMLLCYYYKNYYLPNSEDQVSQSYLGLYNFSENQWVYERIPLGDYNWLEGFTPTIIGERVYHTLSGGVAECRNILSGQTIWRKEGDYDYSFHGFIVVGNRMIVQDNRHGYLMALDIVTGNEVWRHENIFTASEMQQLNGVVYFASVTKSSVYAIDVSTGECLWRLRSPDLESDPYNSFMIDFCTVVPGHDGEKGRVIVSSYTHAYCYEAAK